MSGPTPGPWTLTVCHDAVYVHGGPGNDDIADFCYIDEHPVLISKEEAIANATLFVAAPDLLDAARAVVAGWYSSAPDAVPIGKLQEAIAKATVAS